MRIFLTIQMEFLFVSKKGWYVTKEHAKKRRVIMTPSGIRTALALGDFGLAGAILSVSEDSSGCRTAFSISEVGILKKDYLREPSQ